MTKQPAGAETNFLPILYQDLFLKSAMNVEATLRIIIKLEELALGRTIADNNRCYLDGEYLPGKPPKDIITEFKRFLATNPQPDLQYILALRNSLDRYQSL